MLRAWYHTIIYAHSPQAKGRIERAWRTFQDRLIPELRLRGKLTMAEANEYLEKEFLPNYWNLHNKQAAQNSESHYRVNYRGSSWSVPSSFDI